MIHYVLTAEVREAARLGRALADPTRRRVLLALLDGPTYPAGLAERLGLGRSNVSNHLACLRGCGLVIAHYEGRQVRYELADPHLASALGELLEVVLAVVMDPNLTRHSSMRIHERGCRFPLPGAGIGAAAVPAPRVASLPLPAPRPGGSLGAWNTAGDDDRDA